MATLLIFPFILAILSIGAIIFHWHKKRKANELLVMKILEILYEKFSRAEVTIEGHAQGALIKKMHAENVGAAVTYEWPVGKNPLELPRVLSGTMTDVLEWNEDKFSFLQFTIAHEKENAPSQRAVIGYQITLKREDGLPLSIKGIIGKNVLATSAHLSNFDRVVARIGGES